MTLIVWVKMAYSACIVAEFLVLIFYYLVGMELASFSPWVESSSVPNNHFEAFPRKFVERLKHVFVIELFIFVVTVTTMVCAVNI